MYGISTDGKPGSSMASAPWHYNDAWIFVPLAYPKVPFLDRIVEIS